MIAQQQGGTLADTALVTITAGAGTTLVSEGFGAGAWRRMGGST